MLSKVLEKALEKAPVTGIVITPPLPSGGPYPVRVSRVRAIEGRVMTMVCVVFLAEDGPGTPVLWKWTEDQPWDETAFAPFDHVVIQGEEIHMRWVIGADGQIEGISMPGLE
jgi:hypothetical protein